MSLDTQLPAVLIVDDEPANLLALEGMLARSGARFYRATTGTEALHLASQVTLALIILDDRLPDMRGGELARRLGQLCGDDTPPIVMHTSGDTPRATLRELFGEGILDVDQKPVDPDMLRSKVRTFLRLHRRRGVLRTGCTE